MIMRILIAMLPQCHWFLRGEVDSMRLVIEASSSWVLTTWQQHRVMNVIGVIESYQFVL